MSFYRDYGFWYSKLKSDVYFIYSLFCFGFYATIYVFGFDGSTSLIWGVYGLAFPVDFSSSKDTI